MTIRPGSPAWPGLFLEAQRGPLGGGAPRMAQTAGDAPRKVARQLAPPWLQLVAGRYASVVRCWSVKARTLVRDDAGPRPGMGGPCERARRASGTGPPGEKLVCGFGS